MVSSKGPHKKTDLSLRDGFEFGLQTKIPALGLHSNFWEVVSKDKAGRITF